ncbi:alpha/beta hydrolase family protein [Hymenobacter rigui]|uniref:Alpha/beta fold hydrolase n=1 Tax=Hymenobacter rigui TaxID=334424 RepID=A0A3R9MIP4_9BACT|nr:alpha/beta fold hydrolase [Hymenobacter rigui]RSK43160.1 alpha/beta fold hydrolase [Hymenobacter rigui]
MIHTTPRPTAERTQYVWLLAVVAVLLAAARSGAAQSTDIRTEQISFTSAGVTLAGSLVTPPHPVAAVVIVHGSGQEKRQLELALRLARRGIATLTYDKRGVGESGGVYAGPEVGTNNVDAANLSLLAADASAASATLAARLPALRGRVGLLGASQAGWVIPLAAQKSPIVRFMVIFSGPVVSVREQLRFQFFTAGNEQFWDTHTEAEARRHLLHDSDRYQFEDTDAQVVLSMLGIPGLWLYGGRDIQAPAGISMEHLDSLRAQGKRYQYRLYPVLGHNTMFASSPEPVEDAIRWMEAFAHSDGKSTKHKQVADFKTVGK